jgi:L-ribulokinase
VAQLTLGLDFGTQGVRAVLVDVSTGRVAAEAVAAYAHGDGGLIRDAGDPGFARQHPADYEDGLYEVVGTALDELGARPDDVVAIGTAATASTPIPVDATGAPLATDPRFDGEPAALAWLWKDHTAADEAEEITARARVSRPHYLERCGGTYSAEWFWAKVLRCQRTAGDVFRAAHSWVELCDYVPALLTGVRAGPRMKRSLCAAGHKALFAPDWGGLPDAEFLAALAPDLAALRPRLYERAHTADQPAGVLDGAMAARLRLRPGTPVAVGTIDAHAGAVGAGIAVGDVVKVIGTSSCDMAVAPKGGLPPAATGLCGVVEGSILPGLLGYEAGQAAVGDVFHWTAGLVGEDQASLTEAASASRPGASGLLALDWLNGNRSVLGDQSLTGVVLGLTLHTTAAEVYRAMLEATAFGARMIADRLGDLGVPVRNVIACGGVARRNPLLMQVYADVLGCSLRVAGATQATALGAAIFGAVAAGKFDGVAEAQARLVPPPAREYSPVPAARAVYDRLYALYRGAHDAFGRGARVDMREVMKTLLRLRHEARGGG